MTRRPGHFLLVFVLVIATVFALEGIAGVIVGDRHTHLTGVNSKTAPHSFGYFAPDQQKTVMMPGLPNYHVTIDDLGLRKTKAIPGEKRSGTYRILCVGDSLTFGLFIDDEDTYPYLLQERLDQRSDGFEVLNAGIGGATVADVVYDFKRSWVQLDPDLVIVFSAMNDLREMRDRQIPYYEQIKADFDYDFIEGLVKAVKRTRLYRLFTVAENHYKYHRFLLKVKNPEIKHLYRVRRGDRDDAITMARHKAEGVTLDPLGDGFIAGWEAYFDNLVQLKRLVAQQGGELLYVVYPEPLDVLSPGASGIGAVLASRCEKHELAYVDLTNAFLTYPGDPLDLYHKPPVDFHLNRKGNQLLVSMIEGYLSKVGLLSKSILRPRT